LRFGSGKASQRGKLIHQTANGLHGACYGFRAGPNDIEGQLIRMRSAFQMPLDALGRERDGSERIFDLVCHTTRYFAPSCLFLGFQEIGKIFEHDYVP
jgi:hypothetical protein